MDASGLTQYSGDALISVLSDVAIMDPAELRHFNHQESGLHVLYEPDEDKYRQEDQVEIIAIHAPRQEWKDNWTSRKNNYCWLQEEVPKRIPLARISCFGYAEGLKDAADSLMSELFQERQRYPKRAKNPIVLIGHSAGGTIAKKLFLITHPDLNLRDQVQEIHNCIKGFVFLGTDHYNWPSGVMLVDWLKKGFKQFMPAKDHMQDLEELRSEAPRINHDFAFRGGENLPMACFYETATTGIRGKFDLPEMVPQKNAILPYAWVENRRLKKGHMDLGRFNDDKDCSMLVDLIKYIIMQITGRKKSKAPGLMSRSLDKMALPPVPSDTPKLQRRRSVGATTGIRTESIETGRSDTTPHSSNACLLSLDGGGIRGIFSVVVLEEIMEAVRKLDNPTGEPPRPCEYFNIIGGTSTGGLLAVMLGRLRMDLVSCRVAYKALSAKIFKQSWARIPGQNYYDNIRGNPLYSGEALKEAIQEIVADRLTMKEKATLLQGNVKPSDAPLASREDPDCKTFVCAVMKDKEGGCQRLRTYDSKVAASPCKIWEACRATSAAPTYFPAIEINGHTYYDGGVISNNPVKEVYEEAKDMGLKAQVGAIVSIGTGKDPQANPGKTAWEALSYALKRMTGTQSDHLDFEKRPEVHGKYFRFNEEHDLHKIDMADWNRIGRVEEIAYIYVAQPHIKENINKCARMMAKSTRRGMI